MAQEALLLPVNIALAPLPACQYLHRGGGGGVGDWSAGGSAHLGFPPVTVESFLC